MNFSLTSAQQTFYTEKVTHDMPVWNHAFYVMFSGRRSGEELIALLNEIIKENEVFRLRFAKDKHENIFQSIDDYEEKGFDFFNFESIKELDSFMQKSADTPCLLCKNPYEFSIFRLPGKFGIMLRIHHMLSDGFCVSLLIDKIKSKLGMIEKETKIYSYQRHIEDELLYKESKRFEKNIAFWNRNLSQNFSNILFDIGVSDFDYSSAEKAYSFSVDCVKQVKIICKKENIPFSSLVYAMFAVYVKRVLEIDDFSVGMPILNRLTADDMHTLGLYTHILPLIMHVSDKDTFISLLEKAYDSVVNLLKNQKFTQYDIHNNCTFEKKDKALFDVTVDFQPEYYLSDCEFKVFYANKLSTPLEIHFYEGKDDTLSVRVRYRTNIFRESNITDMLGRLEGILEAFAENPFALICEASIESKHILTEEEKQKLLYDFNATAFDYPKDKCVHQLFEDQAEKTPKKTAVIASDRTLTYRELNEEANKIAHSLIERGIGVGDIVAFRLPRKSSLIPVMFGILKAGAAYLPVDPDWPQERIEYMLGDSGAKILVTEDNIEELLNNSNSSNPDVEITAENICYCIYTSGSTGMPKGVLIKHKNVLNYVSNNANNVPGGIIKENCRNIVSVTTATFDIFVTESLMPLVNGMTVIMADEKQSNVQKELNELLKKIPADVLQTTPSKMKMLISNRAYTEYLKAMKVILIGGEAMDASLAKELKEITDAEIYNIYGPTETTVWSSYAKIENGDITIGKPIANTQIYILDNSLNSVPIGVTGELCIAGNGVGAGYLNRPELTAEKFVDNPFGEGKLYKTGDLAYWREDGNIVYVGRNDFQVKVRGLRIELGEIENAITSIDGIENAVVIVRNDETGRQLICAFYTGSDMDAKEIRAHIGKKLPKYMLPHILTHLDEMPLTSSGKIDRNALPQVDLNNISQETEFVAATTEEEILLTEAIKAVLKKEKVGVNDNFFDLGGDSLKAIELTAILESKGYSVEIRKIFDSENLTEIAENIREKTAEEAPAEYGNVLAATSAQMRVYTAQMLDEGSTLYNIPYAFKTESVDAEKLEKAINTLIERHESLRTHFENRNGEIVQVIDEKAKVNVQKLESEDISDFIKPFDLEKSPLIHAGYYKNTVMIDLHHIIADGESLPVFYRELNELYMGRELNDAPVQYGEFAVRTGYTKENEEYWLGVFEDEVPTLNLNTDYPRKGKRSFSGSNVYEIIDIELHNKISEKCRELSITSYVYYMAAFNILMSKYSTDEDIVVGTPASGRTAKYLETIGMFVNTLAVRNKPEGTKTVKEFLEEVRENSVKALDNQNYPFGTLVKKLGIEANGRNPLYDVTFAYESEKSTDIIFADKKAELLTTPLNTAKNNLSFYVMPREDDVVFMAEYCTDLFEQGTIKKYIASYKNILSELLNEEKYIKDISAVSEAEKQKLLYDFNDTKVPYDKSRHIYDIFAQQVKLAPQKLAVVYKNNKLSYSNLYQQINEYADKLSSIGIKKGDIVAVHLDKSPLLIILQFAVLKLGAIFLPADKRYPSERLRFLCSDCDVKLFISDSDEIDIADTVVLTSEQLRVYSPEKHNTPAAYSENAYIIYTSGSTGAPKGCILRHCGLVNFCINNNTLDFLNKREYNVFASVNSVSFDYFIAESLLPLLNGFTTVLCDEDESLKQDLFLKVIKKHNVNVLMTTPTRLSLFYDDKHNCEALNALSCVCSSGEPLPEKLLKRIYEVSSDAKVFNPLGPSECTVWDLGGELKREAGCDVHIGKPIANTKAYILDAFLNPVPIGVTGELCIAGDGVGAGYLNRPELTAEKFVDNPFGEGELYRTGDLAYWREDGDIVYAGRNDFQVKVRGLRIEPGEVELALTSIDYISSATVVARHDPDLLIAFYTGKKEKEKALRAELRRNLPSYMIPSRFIHLDSLPVTTSGKIDRVRLFSIELPPPETELTEKLLPRTPMEKHICDLFSQVLSVENVNLESNFFDLGGTSLEMISVLAEEVFSGITAAEFLAAPTPGQLAKLLEERSKQNDPKLLEPLYVPENSKRSFVLFSYAGGDASAYAALVNEFHKQESEIALYYVDWPEQNELYSTIADEIKELATRCEINFYSHCAGAVVALKLLEILNSDRTVVKNYIAGASIPPKNHLDAINKWAYLNDRSIIKYLEKGGFNKGSVQDSVMQNIIRKFRIHTNVFSAYFSSKKEKINCKTFAIISRFDPFTKNYMQSDILWKKIVTDFEKTIIVDYPTHYFQSDNAEQLSDYLIKIIKNN